jgi:hypothetical protein
MKSVMKIYSTHNYENPMQIKSQMNGTFSDMLNMSEWDAQKADKFE